MSKRFSRVAMVAAIVAGFMVAGMGLFACDPVSKSATQTLFCNDEEAPLLCVESQICCAETHPYECNNKCYRTRAQAQSDCGGDVNDCS